MIRSSAPVRQRSRGPFWILALAWACAVGGGHVAGGLGQWLAGGRHFSHQERLAAEVASLLSPGKRAAPAIAHSAPAKPPPAPMPANDSVRRLEFSAPQAASLPVAAEAEIRFPSAWFAAGGLGRSAPRLTPPRAGARLV